MRIRPLILSSKQPKCYIGDGLLIKSGHWEVELDQMERAVMLKILSQIGMLNPAYLEKLKNFLEKSEG